MKKDKRLKRKVLRSYVVSTVSISLVLFLLGSVGYMLTAAIGTAFSLRENITISAELDNSVGSDQQATIKAELEKLSGVRKVQYVDKNTKIEDAEFRRMFASEIEEILSENPLRNSFEVAVVSGDRDKMDELVDDISAIDGVVYVAYPAATIERLHSTISKITILLVVFGGALLTISMILLNNTIRLMVYARRELINTLKAVGATKWFIMRPFVGRSALQGLFSGLLAVVLLVAALYGLDQVAPGFGLFPRWEELAVLGGSMVALGIIVAVVCTLPIVNRFVNMKSNKIHLC